MEQIFYRSLTTGIFQTADDGADLKPVSLEANSSALCRKECVDPPSPPFKREAEKVYCWIGEKIGLDPRTKHVCDAPDRKTWFRIETEAEAEQESALMDHAVAKHFRRERENAVRGYKPPSTVNFEQNIGLRAHIQREMPLFLTLRDAEGGGLVTAMLPPGGGNDLAFRIIIVGKGNSNPYPEHEAAIHALGAHFSLTLERVRCYPCRR